MLALGLPLWEIAGSQRTITPEGDPGKVPRLRTVSFWRAGVRLRGILHSMAVQARQEPQYQHCNQGETEDADFEQVYREIGVCLREIATPRGDSGTRSMIPGREYGKAFKMQGASPSLDSHADRPS